MSKNINFLTMVFASFCSSLSAMNLSTINNATCSLNSQPFVTNLEVKPQVNLMCEDKSTNELISDKKAYGQKEKIVKKNKPILNVKKRSMKERKLQETLKGKSIPIALEPIYDEIGKWDFSKPLTYSDIRDYAQLVINRAYQHYKLTDNSLIGQWIKVVDDRDEALEFALKVDKHLHKALKKNKSFKLRGGYEVCYWQDKEVGVVCSKDSNSYWMIHSIYYCFKDDIDRKKIQMRLYNNNYRPNSEAPSVSLISGIDKWHYGTREFVRLECLPNPYIEKSEQEKKFIEDLKQEVNDQRTYNAALRVVIGALVISIGYLLW